MSGLLRGAAGCALTLVLLVIVSLAWVMLMRWLP